MVVGKSPVGEPGEGRGAQYPADGAQARRAPRRASHRRPDRAAGGLGRGALCGRGPQRDARGGRPGRARSRGGPRARSAGGERRDSDHGDRIGRASGMAEARGSAAPDAVRIAAARLRYERLPLIALAMAALLASLWAGLLRLGWNLPVLQPALYTGHGPLMVCGFLGTLIGLERAVALERGWCYAAPVLSAAGGLALIAGVADPIGPALVTLGSAGLVGDFAVIV